MKLLQGDCFEVMQNLEDNSVDLVLTDPPYGLAFMGKKWDYDVPTADVWVEALRVLKPGGHLLAFAGTRTQHRMACRIEDAGFEIRDCIMWHYGSGFPKSHNFGCKCTPNAVPYTHEEIPRKQATECNLHPLRDAHVSQAMDTCQGRRQVLQPCMQEQGAPTEGREQLSATEVRAGQSVMEGRGDVLEEARQLQADQVRSLSSGVSSDGKEGRLHHGAPPIDGDALGALPESDGSGASRESRSARQQAGKSGVVSRQRDSQKGRVASDQVCQECGGLIGWTGWGTALKPSTEIITMARKPLVGTVAANVMEYGTGGLNIDACKIGTNGGGTQCNNRDENGKCMGHKNAGRSTSGETFHGPNTSGGRWPANLIHDGSDEATDALGHASGYFYCAKASKKDRGEGNNHATVKPIALMEYLVKLASSEGQTILDPFMGSGTTGIACRNLGREFIGIEMNEEYMEIAKRRLGVQLAEDLF